VERLHVFDEKECHVKKSPHVVDIVQPTLEPLQDAPILKDLIKEEMCMCSLLSMPHLPARCTQGRDIVILYS
jgi:hypothetical protein